MEVTFEAGPTGGVCEDLGGRAIQAEGTVGPNRGRAVSMTFQGTAQNWRGRFAHRFG